MFFHVGRWGDRRYGPLGLAQPLGWEDGISSLSEGWRVGRAPERESLPSTLLHPVAGPNWTHPSSSRTW